MEFSHSCPAYPVGVVNFVGAVGPVGAACTACAASSLLSPVRPISSAPIMLVNLLLFCQRSSDVSDVCTSLNMLSNGSGVDAYSRQLCGLPAAEEKDDKMEKLEKVDNKESGSDFYIYDMSYLHLQNGGGIVNSFVTLLISGQFSES